MTVIEKLDMNVKQTNSDFVAIKNKIVEKGVEVADGTRTADYAQKINEVYEAGRKAEYDEFWGSQSSTNDWTSRFAGRCWNETTFKPPYDLILNNNCNNCFYNNGTNVDLVEWLSTLGIVMSTVGMTSATNLFNYSTFTRLGVIDLSNLSTASTAFANMSKLVTIDKLIVSEKLAYNSTFQGLPNLVNLTIEGTIGKNGLNLQWSTKLTHDSLASIINCLQDKSQDTSGTEWKVIVGSENLAKLTDDDMINITAKGWVFE